MGDKHELADQYISEVQEEYRQRGREMGETSVAIALIRACEDLLIEREKIQRITNYLGVSAFGLGFVTPPGETPEVRSSRLGWQGHTIPPDAPVSSHPDPSSQAVSEPVELPDTELPGMWSNSDFMGRDRTPWHVVKL